MEKFIWGVIGPGSIAKEFADDLKYAGAEHAIGAVLSNKPEEAREFAKEKNAPQYFDDINEFLDKAKIDAAYVATPHPLHYGEVMQCLERKIPVLCEKPMAMNARQTKMLTEASVKNNTFLMEGMWIRFLPSIKEVISIIEKGRIGDILSIKSDLSYVAPKDPNNRYFNPHLGGGSLLDLGVYGVFLSMLLLGKPKTIDAFAKLNAQHVDENCVALFHYENGAYTILQSSFVMQTELMATIYGDKGKVTMLSAWNEKPQGIKLEFYDGTSEFRKCEWEGRGFQYEIDEVYDCIKKRKIFSDKLDHSLSIDLSETLDEIRKLSGIKYPFDK